MLDRISLQVALGDEIVYAGTLVGSELPTPLLSQPDLWVEAGVVLSKLDHQERVRPDRTTARSNSWRENNCKSG